jgi:choline dehydrogenase-like flavoprotein
MALRKLDEAFSRTIELSASVRIVGAGIAGLVAATRLARDKKRRIVVVESGHGEFKPSVSPLNEIDNPCDNYRGAQTGRARGLGGTSLLWGENSFLLVLRIRRAALSWIWRDGPSISLN